MKVPSQEDFLRNKKKRERAEKAKEARFERKRKKEEAEKAAQDAEILVDQAVCALESGEDEFTTFSWYNDDAVRIANQQLTKSGWTIRSFGSKWSGILESEVYKFKIDGVA